jgi:hypothetical protein
MSWREASGVDFLFGPAKNERLVAEIAAEIAAAEEESKASGARNSSGQPRQLEPPPPGRC